MPLLAKLDQIHRDLGITQEAFEEMSGILERTLEDFEFKAEDIRAVLAEFKRRQPYIVSK